jgi:type I restriction enzyme M protein
MDNAGLQSLLKRLCNVLWSANVTNPITYVTQISYLLFLKMLEEMETDQQAANSSNGRTAPQLFANVRIDDEEVNFSKLTSVVHSHLGSGQRTHASNPA